MDSGQIAELIRSFADTADQWMVGLFGLVQNGGMSFLIAALVLGAILGLIFGRRSGKAAARTEPLLLEKPRHEPMGSDMAEATGVNDSMLSVLRARLREWGTAPEDMEDHLYQFAQQYREMSAFLSARLSDPGIGAVADAAKATLDTGDVPGAVQLLMRTGEEQSGKGREARKQANEQLRSGGAAYILAGDLYLAQEAYSDAVGAYRDAIDVLPANAKRLLADCLSKHGTASYRAGNTETAEESFRHAVQVLEKSLGSEHEDVAAALNNLGLIHFQRDDLDGAEPLYQRALTIDEKALGENHATVATDLNNLALLYKKKGDLARAEPLMKRSIFIKERMLDPDDPSLMTGLRNYAALLRALDRGAEARILEVRAGAAA